MLVAQRCHLGQMRYGKNLVILRQGAKAFSHHRAVPATDAHIHLIEDQGRSAIRTGQNALECEQEARSLAA